MKNRSETFFTEIEKKAVKSAIKEAESHTSGEIVTMVVEKSDTYRDIDIIAGLIISAAISIYPAELVYAGSEMLLRKLIPSLNWFTHVPDTTRFMTGLSVFIALTIILHFPVKIIFKIFPSLKRLILSIKRMDSEVHERALRGFSEHGLNNTKDATGILFLVSILERRVHVLADHGIYTKIKQESLDRYAASIGKGIASGKGGEALCNAIKEAGKELEKYFPRSGDDKNELTDNIITEK